ncbi:MAG: OmpH family outer membrane protein [Candidatus Omnitrophica bacterium]|nr:OmpH family outer membrane protein [Candidatus Omnitrophota bacterium]
MKKRVIAVAVAAFFAAGIFAGVMPEKAYAKEYKIAYVDLAKVFDEYGKTKDSEKNLADKAKGKEDARKAMVEELRKLKDEQALLSEKAKGDKQKVIDDKIKSLQDFDTKTRDELVKERNDMLGGILKDIEKVVTDFAKESGYDLILNSRMLLYGGEQYDLTAEILKKLNK